MTFDFAKRFVQIWEDCDSLGEFCKRMGVDRREASNTAAILRRRGVPLQCFKDRRPNKNRHDQITKKEKENLIEMVIRMQSEKKHKEQQKQQAHEAEKERERFRDKERINNYVATTYSEKLSDSPEQDY